MRKNLHLSLPAWGAWIEIDECCPITKKHPGRSPHGGRGLKFCMNEVSGMFVGRSPHGGRGLKYCMDLPLMKERDVAPRMGGVD